MIRFNIALLVCLNLIQARMYYNILKEGQEITVRVELRSTTAILHTKSIQLVYSKEFFIRFKQDLSYFAIFPATPDLIKDLSMHIQVYRLRKTIPKLLFQISSPLSEKLSVVSPAAEFDVLIGSEPQFLAQEWYVPREAMILIEITQEVSHSRNMLIRRKVKKNLYYPTFDITQSCLSQSAYLSIKEIPETYSMRIFFGFFTPKKSELANFLRQVKLQLAKARLIYKSANFPAMILDEITQASLESRVSIEIRLPRSSRQLNKFKQICSFLFRMGLNILEKAKAEVLSDNWRKTIAIAVLFGLFLLAVTLGELVRGVSQWRMWRKMDQSAPISLARPVWRIFLTIVHMLTTIETGGIQIAFIYAFLALPLLPIVVTLYSLWRIAKRVDMKLSLEFPFITVRPKPSYASYVHYDLKGIGFSFLALFGVSGASFLYQKYVTEVQFVTFLLVLQKLAEIYFTALECLPQIYVNSSIGSGAHMKGSLLIIRLLIAVSDNFFLLLQSTHTIIFAVVYVLRDQIFIGWLLLQKYTGGKAKDKAEGMAGNKEEEEDKIKQE